MSEDEPLPNKAPFPQPPPSFPRPRFWHGIREKLIAIFVAIKVLPLIALAVFAAHQIAELGDTFKSTSNEIVLETKELVGQTGTLATESSIAALDRKSQESIERLTIDIANNIGVFLAGRDQDLRLAAELPVDENLYRQFLAVRFREVVSHPQWVLNKEQTLWVPANPSGEALPSVLPGSTDNEKDFHYNPPNRIRVAQNQPLYHEMTFVGLDGKERLKISATSLLPPGLRDVSRRENTWCKAETYFTEVAQLQKGEMYVSRVIGEYVPSPIIGTYTPEKAQKAGIPFAPEEAAYAGKENPVGKRFQGLVRWAMPVYKGNEKIGYVTLALDHRHIMEFTDHVVPTTERYSDIPDAGAGNYAFIWDDQGRNIAHPRHYFIVGFDARTGEPTVPWLSSELMDTWKESGGVFSMFEQVAPRFQEQSLRKTPDPGLTKQGMLGLDCRYLNFAPQCIGWYNLTQHGGSGSFLIRWSELWKLTTAAAIPYATGQYGKSHRGFGFVTIGANVDEFHSSATATAAQIKTITGEYESNLESKRSATLANIDHRLRTTINNLSLSTGAMVVLVIAIAIWMAAILTRKITAIIQGIKNFQSGQLSFRLREESQDELGQLAGAFNEMSDQLQRSMGEIHRAKERAEESDRAKSLFLANMSHEIRTPMNAILGMTHLVLKAPMEAKQRTLITTVKSSAEDLLRLLDDILDTSKIEAGQLQLNEKPFDLRSLVEDVVSTLHVTAIEKGLHLESSIPPQPALLFLGDKLRLRQILLNLVGNALKFTPSGGTVLLGVRTEVGEEAGRQIVHFQVRDTGIGIHEDKLPLIFNRFEQGDSSYSRARGGVGLGLSISAQLVGLMGGRIWVESKVGEGSTFHVELALPSIEEEQHQAAVAELQDEHPPIQGLRILIADDNAINRDVASMTLAEAHQTETTENGLSALMALSEAEFDLILMDVQMPVLDGLAATRAIRALEEGRPVAVNLPEPVVARLRSRLAGGHIPVLAMTAHAMGGDRENCLQAGMDAYLTKPCVPEQLHEVLGNMMAGKMNHPPVPPDPPASGTLAPTPSGEPPLMNLDPPKVEEIAAFLEQITGFKPEQIQQLVASGIASIRDNLNTAETALAAQDFPRLSGSFHTLKGTLLQCGLGKWAEMAQVINTAAAQGLDLPYVELLNGFRQGMAPLLTQAESLEKQKAKIEPTPPNAPSS